VCSAVAYPEVVTRHPTLVHEQLVYYNKAVTTCNRLNCEKTINVDIVGR